ncbi:hypothetical protein ACNJYD_15975 [Bradyrhizobium sp. DASA03005]|uniref:hypothetical protein n=1 Tax=Bradyrhizobium TaxID=374 RepID=UPI00155E7831|nr:MULTISPECIES: hypothetical protein [Bradyrhizobium]MBR1166746.1 hypothetical protein [Bradyrhizobium liaoningense]MDD1516545.1 hypothetical protein [Bradyrhizobium sp. WBAH30]MDD1542751.1 hypothetical protein [Bradyrhizobium sp. WBAH41]MDD1554448.1 hypothetical protein [Bradyrhizobium sp. WBAH23]MDD1562399.1 hypothetical protein [Bradyrhizobium sp. WBAH33]
MPIFRYFIFVGGALLALLFAADFVFPAPPVAHAVATAGNDQPLIRIRSDRHMPERVVLDTSQPTIGAPAVQTAAVAAPQPAVQESLSPALAEMSAKMRVRETFAQFTPAPRAGTATAKTSETAQPQTSQAQASPVQAQPKRKIVRTHPAPQPGRPMMLVAQQPHFGLFSTTW